jgi:hypothetical protein
MLKIADARSSGVDDLPNDGYGSIPAGYTYFGQLVVHDLTHSVAIAGRDKIPPTLENLRTPSLDLDTIYGGGPRRCPHLYQSPYVKSPVAATDDGQHLFNLGRTAEAAPPRHETFKGGQPLDLPRIDTVSRGIAKTSTDTCVMPLVNDERNDDNLILSQLTAQFLRVHNAVADHLDQQGDPNARTPAKLQRRECFALARHFLLRAYRQAVVHDYLKKLLLRSVYDDMIAGKIESGDRDDTVAGKTKNDNRLPIEFVFGAARVGHAMVRAAYTVNEHFGLEESTLDRLMAFSASTPGANLPVPEDWVVNWSTLLVMKKNDSPQSARRISPFLAPVFVNGSLRTRHTGLKGSLSFHDLWRCLQFNVPTGQDCARQLSMRVLTPEEMLPTSAPVFVQMHPADNLIRELKANLAFREKTPLSYYLLQEAAVLGDNGRFLGPLGSHIYAVAILQALKASADYTPPPGKSGLTLDEILKPKGISTLPQLLSVPDLDADDLRKAIIDTLH